MNTKLIFASLSAGFIATSAMSADLGAADIAQPLPPQGGVADIIHDWGGGYVGIVGGGAVGEVETQTGSGALFSETPLRGGLAGGHGGLQHSERQHGLRRRGGCILGEGQGRQSL